MWPTLSAKLHDFVPGKVKLCVIVPVYSLYLARHSQVNGQLQVIQATVEDIK